MKPTTAGALVLGLAAALLPDIAAAQSQSTVAQLKQVNGNVLVSRDTGMVTGAESLRIADGTRILTTANSEVVVEFDNGCRVHMKENQRLDVDSRKVCAALIPANLAAAPAAGADFAQAAVQGLIVGATLVDRGGGSGGPTPVSPN